MAYLYLFRMPKARRLGPGFEKGWILPWSLSAWFRHCLLLSLYKSFPLSQCPIHLPLLLGYQSHWIRMLLCFVLYHLFKGSFS